MKSSQVQILESLAHTFPESARRYDCDYCVLDFEKVPIAADEGIRLALDGCSENPPIIEIPLGQRCRCFRIDDFRILSNEFADSRCFALWYAQFLGKNSA